MQQPPAKGGSKLIYIILGCVGCLGVMAIGFFALVGGGVAMFAAIQKQAEPAKVDARAFLADAASGNIDAAHAHFSDALKAKKPKEELKAEAEKYPELFNAADATFNNVAINNDVITIRGTVTGKNGKVYNALFRHRKDGDKVKMLEYVLREGPIGENE